MPSCTLVAVTSTASNRGEGVGEDAGFAAGDLVCGVNALAAHRQVGGGLDALESMMQALAWLWRPSAVRASRRSRPLSWLNTPSRCQWVK